MKLPINTDGLILSVYAELISLLNTALIANQPVLANPDRINAITFTFHSPSYSVEDGGYHPVEICLERDVNQFRLAYVTDFSFTGFGQDAELTKEMDFDFNKNICEVRYCTPFPLAEAAELFDTYQRNFIDYYQMEVYQVSIQFEEIEE